MNPRSIRFLAEHEQVGFDGNLVRRWKAKLGPLLAGEPSIPTLKRYQVGQAVRCVVCRGVVRGEPPQGPFPGRLYCGTCAREVAFLSSVGWDAHRRAEG